MFEERIEAMNQMVDEAPPIFDKRTYTVDGI